MALFSGNYNCTLDGANKSLNRLVDHLQSVEGAQVRVFSPTIETPAFEAIGDLVSVPSVPIPVRSEYRLALGLTPAIRRNVTNFRPHIIHLSAPDLLGSGAQRLARQLGVPVVASLHTLFETYLDYYALGWMKALVQRRLWAFYARCDYVLAPTRALMDEVQVEALPARVRLWARGVEPAMFNPSRRSDAWRAAHGLTDDRPVIVYMGRIVLEKGLDVFADTVRRLEAERGPMQVMVIGDGPAREAFAQQLPGAVFTGFLTGEALATALACGDIFFNPSTTETFGNVNLEAMASGLAVVCADAPNTRSILGTDSGLLCPPQSGGAFAEAIGRLMDDPQLFARMRAGALARSEAFRWPEILQSVVDVYQEARALAASREKATSGSRGPAVMAALRRRRAVAGG